MSGHYQAAAGAPSAPVAPQHHPTLLRPHNPPPPPPPCPPAATVQLGAPTAPVPPAGFTSVPAVPAPDPASDCDPSLPPPPQDGEADFLPPYPVEDLGLPADPHLSLPPLNASPLPVPAPLPSAEPAGNNPSEGVYHSTTKLQQQQQQQEAEEGVRRLQSKYASPGSLMPPPPQPPQPTQTPQPPNMASPTAVIPRENFAIPAASLGDGVTDDDIVQVEMFYRSHKAEVHVCRCLVNLYFSAKGSTVDNPQWEFVKTGIPLLLLDSGEHHRQRKLAIILAEKGTGFTLWRDSINHLTKYRAPSGNFHTLHLSKDSTCLVGLSFDDQAAATEFYSTVVNLTSDPNDPLMNLSRSKKDKKKEDKKKKKEKYKPPKKTDISQPCCFMQITKLERPMLGQPSAADQNFMDSMSNLQLSDTGSSQGSLHNL